MAMAMLIDKVILLVGYLINFLKIAMSIEESKNEYDLVLIMCSQIPEVLPKYLLSYIEFIVKKHPKSVCISVFLSIIRD